jgi:hypothetical protein
MSGGHLLCADRSGAETQNHITKHNTKEIGYGELIEMLSIFFKRTDKMSIIYAEYNMYHNSIRITTYARYVLRTDCGKAEEGLNPTPQKVTLD